MALQRRSTCIFPLELVDIMMAFAKELSYIGDAKEVFTKEGTQDKDYLLYYTRRLKVKRQNRKRPIQLLLSLSLVCRAWLVLSRKHLFAQCKLLLDVDDAHDHIERFIELLSEGDHLPNLPNILSFITDTTVRCPPFYSSHVLSKLFEKISNRETYFCPRRLRLKIRELLAPDVFPLVSSVYSTITILRINSPDTADITWLLTSFPNLRTYKGLHPIKAKTHRDMSQHRLPDSLHTVTFDFWLPFFGPVPHKSSNLVPFTAWLQSHPPAPNMRHLALYWGTYIDVEFIDAFLNICPNLKTLTFGTERDPYNKYSDHWVESSVFDLSSVTTVHDLTFDVIPFLDYRDCGGRQILKAVGRILQTVKLSKATITLRLDVYRYFRFYDVKHSAYWWTTIDEAMSKLPQDVTLTIIALHPWENNQETEAFIVDNFRKMLPRTQEQSKLKVVTEFAVFPDDDDDDQYLE